MEENVMREYMLKEKVHGDFITFCEKEKELLLLSLVDIISCIPSTMNLLDNRFDISNFYCNELARDFGNILSEDKSVGYDMLYDHTERISIKFKNRVYQRPLADGVTLGKIPSIAVKNFLSTVNRSMEVSGFDYLLAVEKDINKKNGMMGVGFSVATPGTVQRNVVKNSKSDQLLVKIPNDDWDYFSGVYNFNVDMNDAKQNRRYEYGKKLMYDLLRNLI